VVRWVVIILPVVGINNRWYKIILFGWQMLPEFFYKNGAWCAVFLFYFFMSVLLFVFFDICQ